jgi:hypothetical protein
MYLIDLNNNNLLLLKISEKKDAEGSLLLDGIVPAGGCNVEMFSDAAKYSYTALCSLALRDLYMEDKPHHAFSKDIIHNIRRHLNLPLQTDEVMLALFHGEGVQCGEVYVELVKQEGHAFAFFIVKDLIYHAVRSGKNYFGVWLLTLLRN